MRQEQVALACSLGLSQRRACALWNVSRSGVRYERTKAVSDAPVRIPVFVTADSGLS